jgi:predicted ester cyclase
MSDPETVVRAWIDEVWNGGRLERVADFHPPEFVNEGDPSTPADAAAWHRRNHETFPDVSYTIDELVVSGERVTVRWTATGTHLGTLWDLVPPTGRRVTWRGLHLLTVRGSRIVEVWAVADLLSILEQLEVGLELPR